MVDIISKGTI